MLAFGLGPGFPLLLGSFLGFGFPGVLGWPCRIATDPLTSHRAPETLLGHERAGPGLLAHVAGMRVEAILAARKCSTSLLSFSCVNGLHALQLI